LRIKIYYNIIIIMNNLKFEILSNEEKAVILFNRIRETDILNNCSIKLLNPLEWSKNSVQQCFEFENNFSIPNDTSTYNRLYRYHLFMYNIFKI